MKGGVTKDVIFSERRGQSQKPTEIYEYIEKLVPNGYYLEIFGRRNNLKDKWVTIGNEIWFICFCLSEYIGVLLLRTIDISIE